MKYLVALLCTSVSIPAFSRAIASFRGDALHSGIYEQVGVPLLHGIRWKFKTGAAVISTPAVIDGTAYIGSNDHYLYAVNLADGAQRWQFKTGSRVTSSPAVYDGRVYFGSYDGNIYALDAASGALRWKFRTGNVVHASPAIANGVVYIGSWDSNFYAIDAKSGQERWRFKTGEDHEIANPVGIQSSATIARAWCTSVAAIQICMRSMPLAG
jgi:outer membrane protein assembly factor BamB